MLGKRTTPKTPHCGLSINGWHSRVSQQCTQELPASDTCQVGWANTKGRGSTGEFLLVVLKEWHGHSRPQRRRNTRSFWKLFE